MKTKPILTLFLPCNKRYHLRLIMSVGPLRLSGPGHSMTRTVVVIDMIAVTYGDAKQVCRPLSEPGRNLTAVQFSTWVKEIYLIINYGCERIIIISTICIHAATFLIYTSLHNKYIFTTNFQALLLYLFNKIL